MKTQIKVLAEQCFYIPTQKEAFGEAVEKFAELIVKECIAVANEYQNRGGNCYVSNMIAEHFGEK